MSSTVRFLAKERRACCPKRGHVRSRLTAQQCDAEDHSARITTWLARLRNHPAAPVRGTIISDVYTATGALKISRI